MYVNLATLSIKCIHVDITIIYDLTLRSIRMYNVLYIMYIKQQLKIIRIIEYNITC